MTDRSDTEADFYPTDPGEIAVLNMAISNADTLVAQWLATCNGDPLSAFDFAWLTQNPEVLWLQRKLQINFNEHPACIHNVVDLLDTWIIDYDTIEDWTGKMVGFWTSTEGKYKRHQALLLCYGKNHSGLDPPGDNGFVYSGAVVWVLHDQTRVTVPQAIHHIKSTALLQDEEVAVLCSIPENAPYWVTPKEQSECNLVQLDHTIGVWVSSMDRVCAYCCITYYLEATMRTFVTLNRGVSGRDDIKADELTFNYIEPRGAMWPGQIYVITNNDGDLLPTLNVVPLETADILLPPVHTHHHLNTSIYH